MNIELPNVEAQLNALIAKLKQYQDLSGKTWEEVLTKQGGKLGFLLFQKLRAIAPAKGRVRAERLAALSHGEGIRVHQSARDYAMAHSTATASSLRTRRGVLFREKTKAGGLKRNARSWWQIAVAREIALRESGRGFLGISAHYPRVLGREATAVSKYGPVLSRAGIIINGPRGKAEFVWDPGTGQLASKAAEGVDRPRGRAAIALALRDLDEDIEVYVVRKQQERLAESGLN